MSDVKAAGDRLLSVLPHIDIAANMARIQMPDGKVELGVIIKNATGGRITASFEFDGFMKDIALVAGSITKEGT